MKWEVFNPRDGKTIRAVRFRLVAKFICWRNKQLDYEREGQGWV